MQNFFINENQLKALSFLAPFIIDDEYFYFGIIMNPLVEPPEAVVEQGNDIIRDWYKQQDKYGKTKFYDAKIIIVGEPEAGKTTFRRLLFDRNIKIPDDTQKSTHGISVETKKEFPHPVSEKNKILTNVWDFGGQDIQYNLHHYFLSHNALYVIVTDLRAEKTCVTYWFLAINFFCNKDIPIIALKNDRGDAGNNDVDLEQYKRDFPDLAKNFTEVRLNLKKINDEYKNDWNTLLDYFIPKELVKLNTVGIEGIKVWSEIREKFNEIGEPYIEFEQLMVIADKKGMKNEHD